MSLSRALHAAVGLALLWSVAAGVASAAEAREYVLGHGDALEISVWREPEMQKQVVVRPDGKVSFPLVGDIEAAGKTVAVLKGDIEAALEKYVPDAEASVAVINPNSMLVSVQGRVSRPGRYPITGTTTFLEVMAQAGGPTPFAKTSGVKLERDGEWHTVDYKRTVRGAADYSDFVMLRGDVIYVP
ncbi:MAG TPA: polysaccharide biosynthesis/export family protein [bacterium]|jgi:polysaccharide export outer membrane protein